MDAPISIPETEIVKCPIHHTGHLRDVPCDECNPAGAREARDRRGIEVYGYKPTPHIPPPPAPARGPEPVTVRPFGEAITKNMVHFTDMHPQTAPARERRPARTDGMKFCGRGKHEADVSEFAKSSAATDGLQNWCRGCTKKYNDERIEKRRALRAEANHEN